MEIDDLEGRYLHLDGFNLLVTLESQRRLFNAESQLLTTQRARRTARVNLILALGGPWEAAPAADLTSNTTVNPEEGAQP